MMTESNAADSSAAKRIRIFNSANALYLALVEHIGQELAPILKDGKNPSLALATGNTMIPLYRMIAEKQNDLQVNQWNCFNLDEYYPITAAHESVSFKTYMEQFFYSHLTKPVHYKRILNGHAKDPFQECSEFETIIRDHGGIDLCILGLGQNGHIGFNEPGTDPTQRTHLVNLHADTLMANFKGHAPVSQAMTMGLDSILESRHIVIIALGKQKAAAVRSAIEETITRQCPASFLQDHFSVTWFLDQDAAQFLGVK